MIHTFIQRQLPLLLYGELAGWREAFTRRHLLVCESCRMEFEKLQSLHGLLSAAEPEGILEQDLEAARHTLVARPDIRKSEHEPVPIGEMVARWVTSRRRLLAPSAQALAGAAAGFLLAVILWPSGADERTALEALPPEQIRIENVRFLDGDPAGQDLELSLEAFRPVQVRGSADDPVIQRLLARAILSDRNAGVRLRAVSVLRAPSPEAVDPEIRQALLTAMTSDENAGVRMAALEAVRQLPLDRESRDALLHVILYDVNPGLRIQAINTLEAFLTDFTSEDDAALRDRMGELESDENAYVRWKAKTVLLERGAL